VSNIFEFVVLTRLLDRADDGTGISFPSYRDLTMGMMDRRSAIRSVKALEEIGIISIQHKNFKANTYTIHWDVLKKLIKTSDYQSLVSHSHQSPTVTSDPQSSPSDYQSLPPVTDSHPNVTHINVTQEPNKEINNKEILTDKNNDEILKQLITKLKEKGYGGSKAVHILEDNGCTLDVDYRYHSATFVTKDLRDKMGMLKYQTVLRELMMNICPTIKEILIFDKSTEPHP